MPFVLRLHRDVAAEVAEPFAERSTGSPGVTGAARLLLGDQLLAVVPDPRLVADQLTRATGGAPGLLVGDQLLAEVPR